MKKSFLFFSVMIAFGALAQPTQSDVAYGSNALQKLDYYSANNAGSPILIMVHGGGWATGDKANPTFTYVAGLFKNAGYAVVSINYRLSTQAGYPGHPAIPSDVACAIAWTKLNAGSMNGDSAKIFMYGQSAGAHLVTLHGLTHPPSRLSSCGYSAGLNVAGVIACNPALNFEEINPARHADIKPMVGDSALYWNAAAPAHNLSNGNKTKFMFQIGLNDGFLGTQQSMVFRDSMARYDYCERFYFLPGHDHNSPLTSLSPTDPNFQAMLAFADSLFSNLLCPAIAGEREMAKEAGIVIFPNPARDRVSVISAENFVVGEVALYDMLGALKYSGPADPFIDVTHLPPGVYSVRVRHSGTVGWHRLLVEQAR